MWSGRSASAGSRWIHGLSPSRSNVIMTAHRAPSGQLTGSGMPGPPGFRTLAADSIRPPAARDAATIRRQERRFRMIPARRVALLLLLAVLALAAVLPLAGAAPKAGGVMKVALLRDPTGWDPHINYGATTYSFLNNVYEQ